jgi:hypothetical protein
VNNQTTVTNFLFPSDNDEYYTQHNYANNNTAVRFEAYLTPPNPHNETFMGLMLPDYSQGVAVHVSGTGTREFLAKDGTGSTTIPLTADLTKVHDFEIIYASAAATLYIDRVSQGIITTHVPTVALPTMFGAHTI